MKKNKLDGLSMLKKATAKLNKPFVGAEKAIGKGIKSVGRSINNTLVDSFNNPVGSAINDKMAKDFVKQQRSGAFIHKKHKKTISMSKGQAIKEHTRLVKVLKTGKGIKKEAKEQSKELQEYKKAKKHGKHCKCYKCS